MTTATHIVIADGDPATTEVLADYLPRFGFVAVPVADRGALRAALMREPADLVVMNAALPGAIAMAHELRQGARTPLIMTSHRPGLIDCVIGLDAGADDYLVSPFEPRELVARIRAVLRRAARARAGSAAPPGWQLQFDGWMLDCMERAVITSEGSRTRLTEAEYRLLGTLLNAPRRVLSRDALMAGARGRGYEPEGRSIDLLVSRLRQKLPSAASGDALIRTVRGAGYVLDVASAEA